MILRRIVLWGVLFLGVNSGFSQPREKMTLSLDQSIELALQRNRTLSASREKVEEARAALGEARTEFFPKLSGSATYTKLDVAPFMPGKIFAEFSGAPPELFPKRIPIGRDEIVSMGLHLEQPLFTGFSILNGFRMAKSGMKAARAEYTQSRNDLIYNVQEAYWELVKAQKFVEVAQEAVKQVEGHVKDLENMYDVGMITKNDLLKAKVQLSNSKLMDIQARNGVQLARKGLCNILGLALDTDIHLLEDLAYEPVPEPTVEEASLQAINQRPEINALKASIEIGKRNVDLVTAGYLPSLAFVVDYGYQKPDREYNMDFYTTWTVSLVASMNIFDWGTTHYKRAQAQRQLSQLRESFEETKTGLQLEATQAVLKLKEAEERIRVAEENVRQAQENFNVTEDLFQQGMVTNTEYLDANTLLVQAKTDNISALADYKLAVAQLERATGIIGRGE